MKDFLSSRNVSLGCAAINAVFAVSAVISGSWVWFGVSTGLAALCYHNYLKGQSETYIMLFLIILRRIRASLRKRKV